MSMDYGSAKYPVFFLLLATIVSSCAHRDYSTMDVNIVRSGTIFDRNIGEASGLAVSRIHGDIIWVINDSGNSASVYALNPGGEVMGTLNIQGVSNNDWEDLASFEYQGKSYILIADVGDNAARRKACFLHFIEEPDIKRNSNLFTLSAKPSWSMTYTYEDGPRDCEAVAVDIIHEKVFLLSKRDIPLLLYELPLAKQQNAVARKRAEIEPLPKRTQGIRDYIESSNQPTAMDISPDGLSAVILTYGSAFYFSNKESADWATVVSGSPRRIMFPPLRQAESVCFDKDGSSIFITSEQIPAPLLKIDVSELVSMNDTY